VSNLTTELSNTAIKENEVIPAHIEALGGGYVWEPEMFVVTLIDIPASDAQVSVVSHLRGVEQVALNCSKLSFAIIESIARIPSLRSLVLRQSALIPGQLLALHDLVPEVLLVADDA
jgi:hypothetical protein